MFENACLHHNIYTENVFFDLTECNWYFSFSFWNVFTTPSYGNCFTFNSGMNSTKKVKMVTVTGSQNGLVLELFLDQTNYMYNKLSRKAGARITIHDP